MRLCLALGLLWGTLVVGRTPAADAVTFHGQIQPLLFQHCAGCHRPGGAAPFPLLTFEEAAKRAHDLADVTARRYMPPWLPAPGSHPFVEERRLGDGDIALFRRWADAGAPRGDPAKAPPMPTWNEGWQLGKPDLVVQLPKSYTVPAEGRDVYRNFVLPLNLPQARHVRAWELRPHSRAAHHAFLRVDAVGEGRRLDGKDPEPGFPGMDVPSVIQAPGGHFASWQPGAAPQQNPPGLAWTLQPGTDLILQAHLQPTGIPESFQPELGLYFTDQAPTNQPMKLGLGSVAIDVPPGQSNVVVRDEFVLPAEVEVLGLLPHTHYLGRRIEGTAVRPDGREETLLMIPDWDFNWQGAYRFREPVRLPEGTRLRFALTFDNTTNNVRNPFSPPRRARYGPNTTDEMAELWVQLLPRTPEGRARLDKALLERIARDTVAYSRERLRLDPNDGTAWVNLGKALLSQRRLAEAETHFRKAVEVAPDLDEGHYYVGLLHRIQDRPAEARAAFLKAIQINPNHARAQGNLGFVEAESGRLPEASTHLAEALRLDPKDVLALTLLGKIRLQQGDRAAARELFRRALALDPRNPDALQGMSSLSR